MNTIEEFGKIQSLSYHNESKALIRYSVIPYCLYLEYFSSPSIIVFQGLNANFFIQAICFSSQKFKNSSPH